MDFLEYLANLPDEYIIETWELALTPEGIEIMLGPYSEETTLPFRTEIHKRGLDKDPRVIEADKKLIEYAIREKPYPPVITDDYEPPIEYWWWHIDKIGEGTYPPELIPENLREIYLKFQFV